VAANWIAKLLHRFRWIGYVGLVIVFYVALHMVWEGVRTVTIDLGKVDQFNAATPDRFDIIPEEVAERMKRKK
jgi:predicted tellurium resistance membrane protein TerC